MILQNAHVHCGIVLGHAHIGHKRANRFGRVASPTQASQSRNARIIPAIHVLALNQFQQPTLAHHRVGQIQTIELNLLWMMNPERVAVPIVQRTMVFEFQRTNRVRDAFNRIRLTVSVIVSRINAPFVSGAMMFGMPDAIHNRVTHQHVLVRHVDLGTQHVCPVGKLTGTHAKKQIQILLDRTTAVRTVDTRFARTASTASDLFQTQTADIGFVVANQLLSPLIDLFEVVRCIEQTIFPVKTEPSNVVHDRIDVLHLFFFRVGVIKSQVALSAVLFGNSEVETDRFGVSDVQIAVRFRRKTSVNTTVPFSGFHIFVNDLTNKVAMGGNGRVGHGAIVRRITAAWQ